MLFTTKLLKHLNFLTIPHPRFKGSEESIFTPKEGIKIKFLIEGGFSIEGGNFELEINLNDPGIVFLVVRSDEKDRMLRTEEKSIIGYELDLGDKVDNSIYKLLKLKPPQKN